MSTPLTSHDAARFTQLFAALRYAPVHHEHLRPKTVEDVLTALVDIRQALVSVADESAAKSAELAAHARMFSGLRELVGVITDKPDAE